MSADEDCDFCSRTESLASSSDLDFDEISCSIKCSPTCFMVAGVEFATQFHCHLPDENISGILQTLCRCSKFMPRDKSYLKICKLGLFKFANSVSVFYI